MKSLAQYIIHRGWRPFQQWGFAVIAVGYGARPLFDLSFDVATFGALAAAGGVGFLARGAEKVGMVAFSEKEVDHAK